MHHIRVRDIKLSIVKKNKDSISIEKSQNKIRLSPVNFKWIRFVGGENFSFGDGLCGGGC